MQSQLLYDFSKESIANTLVLPLLGITILPLLFAFFQNATDNAGRKLPKEIIAFGLVMVICLGIFGEVLTINEYLELKSIYKDKTYKTIEGLAKNLTRSTKGYYFEIDTVSFSESGKTYGYKGGYEVKNGMPLKIFYDSTNNTILHIEIVPLPVDTNSVYN